MALCTGLLAVFQAGAAGPVADRFRLLSDRFAVFEDPSLFRGSSVLELSAAANRNTLDVIDEATRAAQVRGTDEERLQAAQEFLRRRSGTEQFAQASLGLGAPLPSFRVRGWGFAPRLAARVDGGLLLDMRSERISADTIVDFLGSNAPPDLREALRRRWDDDSIQEGQDIIRRLVELGDISPGIYPTGLYFMPNKDDTLTPVVESYMNVAARAGPVLDFSGGRGLGGRFGGRFALYGLGRADFRLKADGQTIYRNEGVLTDLPDELNKTVFLAADVIARYRRRGLHVFGGVEELAVSTLSDNEEKGGALLHEPGALLRLHGEQFFRLVAGMRLWLFSGLHKRTSYETGDGLYGGADLSLASLWGDRLGITFRGMADEESLTFASLLRLGFLKLDYVLKRPSSSAKEKDGTKVSALHSVRLGLFF